MPGSHISLPPFTGATRQIVLAYMVAFFGLGLLSFALPHYSAQILDSVALIPLQVVHGHLWQLLTYTFWPGGGILNIAFGLLTIWFTAGALESLRGRRWLGEFFYVTVLGGSILLTCLSFAHIPLLRPDIGTGGLWSLTFSTLVAFGTLFAEQEILFFFVIRMKAKYLVALYVLIDAAVLIRSQDGMGVALRWCCGLCAWLFVRYAPTRGFAFGLSEGWYGLRNRYYRAKRRRAAKKFEVYMRKQDRIVHFDADGHYIAPEEEERDPKSRKWMN